jgi:hypothetical protein
MRTWRLNDGGATGSASALIALGLLLDATEKFDVASKSNMNVETTLQCKSDKPCSVEYLPAGCHC